MKNLHKKIGAVVLAGMFIAGWNLSSVSVIHANAQRIHIIQSKNEESYNLKDGRAILVLASYYSDPSSNKRNNSIFRYEFGKFLRYELEREVGIIDVSYLINPYKDDFEHIFQSIDELLKWLSNNNNNKIYSGWYYQASIKSNGKDIKNIVFYVR